VPVLPSPPSEPPEPPPLPLGWQIETWPAIQNKEKATMANWSHQATGPSPPGMSCGWWQRAMGKIMG